MTSNKKGFTLLELLIAAALLGVLALFATQAFRASSSDVRVEDTKARASLLFSAAQRYFIEYPSAAWFDKDDDDNKKMAFRARESCNPSSGKVQNLVNCGFLEYRQVAQETFVEGATEREFVGYADIWFDVDANNNMQVCFKGKAGGRILDECTYCTSNGVSFESICPEQE